MDILFLLIPLSVVLAVFIGAAFWRAVDTGQFDDLESPGVRVLADDDRPAGRPREHSDPRDVPGRIEHSDPGLTHVKTSGPPP